MKKGWKIALIALLVLVILGAAGAGYIHSKLKLIDYDDGKVDVEGTIDDNEDEVQDQQAEMERAIRQLEMEASAQRAVTLLSEGVADREESRATEETEAADTSKENAAMEKEVQDLIQRVSTPAQGEIYHDDNVWNILLIGTDEWTEGFSTDARGDSCMLLSLNKATGAAKLVSLERGMGVPILEGSYKGKYDWLTHTFRYGGADLMMREVRECLLVDVHHYVRVNFATFIKVISAVGGVDIYLTQAEANYINQKAGKQEYSEGTNHLPGWSALQYARCRKIDSDWQRIRRQRTVIQAVINATRDLSVGELDSLLNQVLPLVRTNLSQGELVSLMSLAPRFQGVTLQQMTIPASGTYGGMRGMGGRSLYAVDFDANAKILKSFLYG